MTSLRLSFVHKAAKSDNQVRHKGHLLVNEYSDLTAVVNNIVRVNYLLPGWWHNRVRFRNHYTEKISTWPNALEPSFRVYKEVPLFPRWIPFVHWL
jgi:hypothetical protein